MNVRLSHQQKEMLIKVKDHFQWSKEFYFEDDGASVVLKNIEECDAIDLREFCSDYLLEIGFDEKYMINEIGKILEELVDKLYVE